MLTAPPPHPQPESPRDAPSSRLSAVDAGPPEYASGSYCRKPYKPPPPYSEPQSSSPKASRSKPPHSLWRTSRQNRSTAPAPPAEPDRSPALPSTAAAAHRPTQGSAAHGSSRGTSPDADNKLPHPPIPALSSKTPRTHTPAAAAHPHPQSASHRRSKHHHRFSSAKLIDKPLHQRHRLQLIAGVVMHLPAARLPGGKLHRMPQPFQHLHHSLARLREQRVVIAGNK